jgi:hypothetical protein
MKVWVGYGSEHSANLVIIGKFKTETLATDAKSMLERLAKIAREDQDNGVLVPGGRATKFSDEMLDTITKTPSIPFTYQDPEHFLYEHDIVQNGSDVVITTEEMSIEAFLKVFIQHGAKVEVYSAHDYASKYGRPTFKR